ncbi:MAG TPA: ergothioneine biosynthesis protein EgtB [Casimicrobiaceae bacterium]|nr:ergothioneine biosynthesis protein EgtB [Casimicrobiaceae bacterium]
MKEPLAPAASMRALLPRYDAVRTRTRSLVAPLSPEDCALQSMPDASPAKWHLGHTTWFFETFVVAPNVPSYRTFDPAFRVLFNSYYHAVGDRHPRPERGMLSRPSLDVVLAYRAHVDDAMRECCERAREDPALASLIELGLAHEEQHQELILTDVLHLFSRNPLYPAYDATRKPAQHDASALEWIRYRAGLATIGHDGDGFAFDNETPRHRVWIEPFTLASRPVNNAEFLAFIEDGGYRRAELWLSLGFDMAMAQAWNAPLYWVHQGDRWREFTLHGLGDLDPHAPVTHVSYFEADAYARWAGARLPTEFEWEAVASRNDTRGHDQPVREGWRTATQSTIAHGEVWEWTSSSYAPYPGFHAAEGAIGEYNGKFMCNQYVLRGGSRITPPGHARTTYRNFFPPDARWQWSGVRLARDAR